MICLYLSFNNIDFIARKSNINNKLNTFYRYTLQKIYRNFPNSKGILNYYDTHVE